MKPWIYYIIGAAILIAGAVFARGFSQVSVGTVQRNPTDAVRFPEVQGSNLEGRKFNLPTDFAGKLNLVAIAFFQSHQTLVDSWSPAVTRLLGKYNTLKFYELPTLSKENSIARAFIDGGMRAGIASKATREITITLYLDRAAFIKAIGETSDQTLITLLVNQKGDILWRGRGAYSQAQEELLERILKQ